MERCKSICVKQQRAVNHMYKKAGIPLKDRDSYFICMEERCNPGCKGTLFEEGPHWFSHMKTALQQKKMLKKERGKQHTAKNKKQLNNALNSIENQFLFSEWHKERNAIMKESSGKLLNKNSFYRTMKKHPWMNKSTIKNIQEPSIYKRQMQKQGHISGCYRYW